jgi:hypothetical protein
MAKIIVRLEEELQTNSFNSNPTVPMIIRTKPLIVINSLKFFSVKMLLMNNNMAYMVGGERLEPPTSCV